MKSLNSLGFWLGLLAGLAGPLLVAKDKGPDILISADAIPSPEGFRPKPGKPIHYLLTQSRLTLGDAVANVKLPDVARVERAVVAELAKQGFVRTEVGGPLPEIAILATIGDANFEQPKVPSPFISLLTEPDFEPYLRAVPIRDVLRRNGIGRDLSIDDIFGERTPRDLEMEQIYEVVLAEAIRIRERVSARGRDRSKIVALAGGPKVEKAVAEGAMSRSAGERVAWVVNDNRYYVTLSAFDAARWKEKQQVLLWRTSMLIDWREDFSKSLEEMLAQAGPLFGTDLALPGYVNTAKTREGKVEIGDAKVVSEKEAVTTPRPKK